MGSDFKLTHYRQFDRIALFRIRGYTRIVQDYSEVAISQPRRNTCVEAVRATARAFFCFSLRS
jgi:hypothetical protein